MSLQIRRFVLPAAIMSATSGLLLSGKLSSANILLNGCAIGFVASVDDVLNSAFLPRSEIAKIDQAYAEMDERPVPRAVFTRPPSGWRRVHSGQPVKKMCMCHLIPFRLDEEKATIEQTIERTRFSTTDVDFEAFDEEGAVAPEHAADRAAEMSAAARRDAPGVGREEDATEEERVREAQETLAAQAKEVERGASGARTGPQRDTNDAARRLMTRSERDVRAALAEDAEEVELASAPCCF